MYDNDMKNRLPLILPLILTVFLFMPGLSFSLTLEEAIFLAKKNLPSYRASGKRVESSRYLYKSSLSPYLPKLDMSGSREYIRTSPDTYDYTGYNVSLSYTLFDGGKRRADRNIARLNLDSDREEMRKNLLNLEYNTKVMFYTVIAGKEIFEQTEIQIKDAQKDYEIAQGKHRMGVAMRSDVLQASVRLQQTRFDLRQARGEFSKALYDLNSFLGRPLDMPYDIKNGLSIDLSIDLSTGRSLPGLEKLADIALDRPIMRQAQYALEISDNNKFLSESVFYPKFSFDLSYANLDTDRRLSDFSTEDKSAAIICNWNIFELDKFYNKKSSIMETKVLAEELSEIKRGLLVEVQKTYEDFITSYESLSLAKQQLVESQFNYDQALGEYKAGKGDILSLVRAEGLLSAARNQASVSRLSFAVSKAALEQAAGIKNIETLERVETR